MKELVLTIDDAPSEAHGRMLTMLRTFHAPAVFFCLGKHLATDGEAAVDAIREGHLLGNHSFSHVAFSKAPIEDLAAEIDKTEVLIDAAYNAAGVRRPAKVFRFPYGDKGLGISRYVIPFRGLSSRYQSLQRMLRERGFRNVQGDDFHLTYAFARYHADFDWFWTCDLKEWDHRPWETIEREIDAIARRPGREILLLHDHAHTHELVERILTALADRGVRFVNPFVLLGTSA